VPSPPRKTAKERNEGDQEDIDATAAGVAELNGARVSRYELVDMMFKEGFEEVMTGESRRSVLRYGGQCSIRGAYVRLMAKETDPMGRPKYRINKIVCKWYLCEHKSGLLTFSHRRSVGQAWNVFDRVQGSKRRGWPCFDMPIWQGDANVQNSRRVKR
jgi:hypothetical protein